MRFDFAEFDSESTNLHLLVGTAEVLENAVGIPPHDVTGPVHPRAAVAVRIRHESFGGQSPTSVVTTRQLWPCQIELTGGTGRDVLQVGIENQQAGVGGRCADRDADGVCRSFLHRRLPTDVDGGLGGAVEVVHQSIRQDLGDLACNVNGQCLTAAVDDLERRAQCCFRLREKHVEHRRNKMHSGHGMFDDDVGQIARVLVPVRLGHHESCPRQERPEEFGNGDVETRRGLLQHPVGDVHRTYLLCPEQSVDHTLVVDHNAFGATGRTRSVDHVRGIRGRSWDTQRIGGELRRLRYRHPRNRTRIE